VTGLRDGDPERSGAVKVWSLVGRASGARSISLRAIEVAAGDSAGWRNADCDEILYVLSGRASILLGDARRLDVEPETGIHVAPGVTFSARVTGPEPLVLVSSRCPDPDAPRAAPFAMSTVFPVFPVFPMSHEAAESRPDTRAGVPPGSPSPVVRLGDREALPTGDRWYRVLVDRDAGCHAATQFVGSIPPGRAPDHYHQYEEVLCILRGRGVMWAGASSAPIAEGSCIYLPRGQTHCVENTSDTELRLLGVFHPAGSPAVRY